MRAALAGLVLLASVAFAQPALKAPAAPPAQPAESHRTFLSEETGTWSYEDVNGRVVIRLDADGTCLVTGVSRHPAWEARYACEWTVQGRYVLLHPAGQSTDTPPVELEHIASKALLRFEGDNRHVLSRKF